MTDDEIQTGVLPTGQGYVEWRGLRAVATGELISMQRLLDAIKLLTNAEAEQMNAGGIEPRITVYPGDMVVRSAA